MNSRRSFTTNRSTSGLTLIEVLVTMAVLSILMTTLFAIFRMGLVAWHKTSTKNDLLQAVQVVDYRLTGEIQLSALESVTVDKVRGAVCFLSPLDIDGKFTPSPQGRPLFQYFIIYYLRSDGRIYRKTVPLPTPTTVPRPIEEINLGSGKRTLTFYLTGGIPMGRFITEFKPDVLPDPISQVTWELTAEQKRYGTDRPESVTTKSAAFLRN